MKKICILLFMLAGLNLHCQLRIGNAKPDSSAIFQVDGNGGVLLPSMDSTAVAAINNPATALMVSDTSEHCLKMFNNNSWNCVSSTGKSIPVKTTKQISMIQDPKQGEAVYDSDRGCMKIYSGRYWQCTNGVGGGPWFTKDAYPIAGMVDSSCNKLSGEGFTVEKTGPGNCTVSFTEEEEYISGTANIVYSGSSAPKGVPSIVGQFFGFVYHTTDAQGNPAGRAISFTATAMDPGNKYAVPVSLEGYYAISGVLRSDGSIVTVKSGGATPATAHVFSCPDYSVERDDGQGTYAISLHNNAQLVSATANFMGEDQNAQGMVSVSRDTNGRFLFRTSGANGALQDKPIVFTAIVSYPDDGSMPDDPDNRSLISGVITPTGRVSRGRGFLTSSRHSEGIYDVTLTDSTRHILSVTATMVSYQSRLLGGVVISKIDAHHFQYKTYDQDRSTLKNLPVGFTIVAK